MINWLCYYLHTITYMLLIYLNYLTIAIDNMKNYMIYWCIFYDYAKMQRSGYNWRIYERVDVFYLSRPK